MSTVQTLSDITAFLAQTECVGLASAPYRGMRNLALHSIAAGSVFYILNSKQKENKLFSAKSIFYAKRWALTWKKN